MSGIPGSTVADEAIVDEATVDKPVVDEHCRGVPAAPLRRYAAWYSGYRQRGVRPTRHQGLPSPYLTLIFTLDEPLTVVAHPDPGPRPGGKPLVVRHLPGRAAPGLSHRVTCRYACLAC